MVGRSMASDPVLGDHSRGRAVDPPGRGRQATPRARRTAAAGPCHRSPAPAGGRAGLNANGDPSRFAVRPAGRARRSAGLRGRSPAFCRAEWARGQADSRRGAVIAAADTPFFPPDLAEPHRRGGQDAWRSRAPTGTSWFSVISQSPARATCRVSESRNRARSPIGSIARALRPVDFPGGQSRRSVLQYQYA